MWNDLSCRLIQSLQIAVRRPRLTCCTHPCPVQKMFLVTWKPKTLKWSLGVLPAQEPCFQPRAVCKAFVSLDRHINTCHPEYCLLIVLRVFFLKYALLETDEVLSKVPRLLADRSWQLDTVRGLQTGWLPELLLELLLQAQTLWSDHGAAAPCPDKVPVWASLCLDRSMEKYSVFLVFKPVP